MAGTASGGLWKTENGGLGDTAWQRIDINYPVLGVGAIALNPENPDELYIGTGEVYGYQRALGGYGDRATRGSYGFGILKTTDGGETWVPSLDWSYANQSGVQDIKFDPNNRMTLWAATTEGIYRTTDAGQTWTQMLDVVMGTSLLVLDDQTVIVACGGFFSEGHGLYRTRDGGQSWDKLGHSALPETFGGKARLEWDYQNPQRIWATIGNGFSIYAWASGDDTVDGPGLGTWTLISDDLGETWELVTEFDYALYQGWYSHFPLPVRDHTILAGVGAHRHVLGGDFPRVSFTEESTAGDFHAGALAPSNHDIVYLACDQGVFRSEDGGSHFEYASKGFQVAQFYHGMGNSPHDTTTIVGCPQDRGYGVRYNGALNWEDVICDEGAYYAFHPTDPDIYLHGGAYLRMLHFSESGRTAAPRQSFEETALHTSFNTPIAQDPSNPNIVYTARSKIYKTEDRGENWTTVNNDQALDENPIQLLVISPSDTQILYAATETRYGRNGVYRTLDAGLTWTNITRDLPQRHPTSLDIDPQNPDRVLITYSGFGSSHLFETLDGGQSWRDLDKGQLPDIPTNVVRMDHENPEILYVGNDLGVYVSTNNGSSWQNFSEGLPSAVLAYDLLLEHDARIIRVGTHGNGAYQRTMAAPQSSNRRGTPQTPRSRDERVINNRRH